MLANLGSTLSEALGPAGNTLFHTQEHTTPSNDPTSIDRVHSEPDSPAVHYTPFRSWSGKLSCVHHLFVGTPLKLHSRFCMNASTSNFYSPTNKSPEQLLLRTPPVCGRVFLDLGVLSTTQVTVLNKTPSQSHSLVPFVFSVGYSSHPNLSPQLLTNWVLVVEVEQVEVDRICREGLHGVVGEGERLHGKPRRNTPPRWCNCGR